MSSARPCWARSWGQAACAGLDDFACCRALAERTGTNRSRFGLPNLPIPLYGRLRKDAMEQAVLEQIGH
ncbi:MAG: hypothetical protein ACLUHE_05405 [Christensenellales bacterium]